MIIVGAVLDAEDLARFRLIHARVVAIEFGVSGYSPTEAEQAFIGQWRLMADLTSKYGLDPRLDWHFDPNTGFVTMLALEDEA